jgi:hypothetical protein
MACTDINSEDRLVQTTFAEHLRDQLGWESVYARNEGTFGPDGTLGRSGLDYAAPDEKYELRALPDRKFSGLHLMCLMYAGFKRVAPKHEVQMDLNDPVPHGAPDAQKRGGPEMSESREAGNSPAVERKQPCYDVCLRTV